MVESTQAEKILGYLGTYQYAFREHVALTLSWHTVMRVGAVHALNLDDYNPREQSLEVLHRPETGTPIKNAERGERLVALSGETCMLLDDRLETQRPNVVEDTGRKPISTSQGRAHQSTLRLDYYRVTRPCIYTGEYTHNKKPLGYGLVEHRDRLWTIADAEHAVASAGLHGAATADELDGGFSDDDVEAWMETAVGPIESTTEQHDKES